jgi:PAS domain S-box-containing protein
MSSVLNQVRRLHAGSVLIALPFSVDKAGTFFISDTGVRKIVAASSVPAFGLWKFLSNDGITGGLLIDEKAYGKALAESAIHIIRAGGFRRVSVPQTTTAQYTFDWMQFQRFGPDREAMPTRYVMLNKPRGLYQTYRGAVLWSLALFAMLIGIVAVLSVNSIRRKRAEEALRASEERLKLALDASSDGIWDWDIQSGKLYCSPRCFTMLGYQIDEIPPNMESWDALIHPDDAQRSSEAMRVHLDAESSAYEVEHRIKAKDGSWRCVLSIAMVVDRDESGKPLRMVGTRTDITDRKEAERERLEFERTINEQKRQFYRETILSVTGGRLEICDHSEIAGYIERAELRTVVTSAEDTTSARIEVEEYLRAKGLDEDRTRLFIMGVGEAITNSIKHAPRGDVYAGTADDCVWVAISDQGKGIESLLIPKVVLLQGYSTKPSMGMGYSIMLDVSDRILLATGEPGTIVLLMKCMRESPSGLTKNEPLQDQPK